MTQVTRILYCTVLYMNCTFIQYIALPKRQVHKLSFIFTCDWMGLAGMNYANRPRKQTHPRAVSIVCTPLIMSMVLLVALPSVECGGVVVVVVVVVAVEVIEEAVVGEVPLGFVSSPLVISCFTCR